MEIYIRRPYTIIDRIYNEEFISGKGKAGENWLRKVSLAFGEKLVSDDLLNSVPRLGPQSIPGTLVRVSGIVQDIFDPELYSQSLIEETSSNSSSSLSSTTSSSSALSSSSSSFRATPFAFRDSLSPSLSSQANGAANLASHQSSHLETRVSIVLLPAPGESSWVKEFVERSTSVAPGYSSPGRKESSLLSSSSSSSEDKATASRKTKRGLGKSDDEDGIMERDNITDNITFEGREVLSSTVVEMESSSSLSRGEEGITSFSSETIYHNQPPPPLDVTTFAGVGASITIPEGAGYNGGEVIVRTYGEDTALKVGELVEIVGIFTHDPELTDFGQDEENDEMRTEEEEELILREDVRVKRVSTSTVIEGSGSETLSSITSNKSAVTSSSVGGMGGSMGAFFPEDELAKNPPASRVPRVHAILARSLSSTYPLMQPPLGTVVSLSTSASPPSSPTSVLTASSSSSSSSSVLSSTSPIEPFGFHDPCVPITLSLLSSSSSSSSSSSASSPDKRTNTGALFKEQEAAQLRALQVRAKREALQRNALHHLPSMVQSTGLMVHQLRAELLSFLTKVLYGDELAAEYLLLHTLSQVRLRKDVTVLDKFSLNLMGFPEATSTPSPLTASVRGRVSNSSNTLLGSPSAQRIHGAVSRLLPRTRFIPLRIDYLNTTRLAPRRDPVTSRIQGNALQLAPGTYLVLDETVISSGRLDEIGLSGLQTLQSVSSSQSLPYDFIHFSTYFDVDTPTLVVSNGRPLVKTDMSIPLSLSARDALHAESSSSSIHSPQAVLSHFDSPTLASFFERARMYIACVRNLPYAMPDAAATAIENDLVSARSADATLKAEDLHLWLILARLSAISHGEVEITSQRWTSVVEMEKKRLSLVRSSTPLHGVSPTGGS